MEIVTRPPTSVYGVNVTTEVITAVSATVNTGQAVKIALKGVPFINYQAKLRYELSKRGFKLHYTFDKPNDVIIAWATRKS